MWPEIAKEFGMCICVIPLGVLAGAIIGLRRWVVGRPEQHTKMDVIPITRPASLTVDGRLSRLGGSGGRMSKIKEDKGNLLNMPEHRPEMGSHSDN